jgi:hypothetical protein
MKFDFIKRMITLTSDNIKQLSLSICVYDDDNSKLLLRITS